MPRLLTEDQRGDAMRERETAPPPKNFKEKLVHFLDYHKWWIFWGVLIFSLGTFMICNTGEKFDYFVAVYAQTSSPEEAGSLYGFPNALAALYGNDLNGDGIINAEALVGDLTGEENYDRNTYDTMIAHMQLNLEGLNSFMVFITDRENYEFLLQGGDEIFAPFEGAPKWVPLNAPEIVEMLAEMGFEKELGITILEKTEKIENDKLRLKDYESAADFMACLKAAFPDMF